MREKRPGQHTRLREVVPPDDGASVNAQRAPACDWAFLGKSGGVVMSAQPTEQATRRMDIQVPGGSLNNVSRAPVAMGARDTAGTIADARREAPSKATSPGAMPLSAGDAAAPTDSNEA